MAEMGAEDISNGDRDHVKMSLNDLDLRWLHHTAVPQKAIHLPTSLYLVCMTFNFSLIKLATVGILNFQKRKTPQRAKGKKDKSRYHKNIQPGSPHLTYLLFPASISTSIAISEISNTSAATFSKNTPKYPPSQQKTPQKFHTCTSNKY